MVLPQLCLEEPEELDPNNVEENRMQFHWVYEKKNVQQV